MGIMVDNSTTTRKTTDIKIKQQDTDNLKKTTRNYYLTHDFIKSLEQSKLFLLFLLLQGKYFDGLVT